MKKQSFDKSLKHAIDGILSCVQKERNLKIHFCMMFLVIICGFIFRITQVEWMVCIILFGLVISLELVNTAIEAIVDLCSPNIHPLAKLAKDAAAGAVLVSALVAAIVGLIIFIPKII